MINLFDISSQYVRDGFSDFLAESKTCQDIILKAISNSHSKNQITIKGGVVMSNITGKVRRATRDIDFDFIKYPIDEKSIRRFIKEINCLKGLTIKIAGPIQELSQHEYRGKRVWITIKDSYGNTYKTKMDIGVHKELEITQEEFCFDIYNREDNVCLLMNSKEQIFAEKLRALVKFGSFSVRVKDLYDIYYLCDYVTLEGLYKCVNTYILNDITMY